MSFLRGLSNSQKELVAYFGAGVITLIIVFVYVGDKITGVLYTNNSAAQVKSNTLSDTGATSYFQDNFSKAFSGLTDMFKMPSSTDTNNTQVGTVASPVINKTPSNNDSDGLNKIADDIRNFNSQFGTTSAGLLGKKNW